MILPEELHVRIGLGDAGGEPGSQHAHRRVAGNVEHHRAVVVGRHDRVLEVRVDDGFMAGEHPGAHLDTLGAEDDGGRGRPCVAYPSCRDDRQVDAVGDQGKQDQSWMHRAQI